MSAAPLARSTDPITSDLAAEGANVVDSQHRVIAILGEYGPMADFQMVAVDRGMFSPQRIRTARHELVKHGLVRKSDLPPALTLRGRRMTHHTVWEVVSDAFHLTAEEVAS